MNICINDMITCTNSRDPYIAALAVSMYHYQRKCRMFASPTTRDFVAETAGTVASLTGSKLDVAVKRVAGIVNMWKAAGILHISADNTLLFTPKYRKVIDDSGSAPRLTEPTEQDVNGFVLIGDSRPLCGGRTKDCISDKQREALDLMQATPYTINREVLAVALNNRQVFANNIAWSERLALDWAEKHVGKDYWLPMFLDWRGRVYTDSGAICSYQGADLHRALCDYSDSFEVVVGSPEWDHFIASVRAEYGVDDSNYSEVIDGPVPASYVSKQHFWCRLRAAFAVREVLTTGRTSYILQQDATCSGMGHMACIMRNGELAEKTALLGPIAKDADLYSQTASTAVSTPRYFSYREQGCSFDISDLLDNADVAAELGARSQAKKTVMVTAYGSSVVGNATGWATDSGAELDENAKPVDALVKLTWDDCPEWRDTGFVATITAAMDKGYTPAQVFLCLANAYGRALDKHHPCIQQFIGHMRRIAQKAHNQTGFAAKWVSSAGMTCTKTHLSQSEETKAVTVGAGDAKSRVKLPEYSTRDGAAGHAPNRIHSEDASLVIDSAIRAADEGIFVSPIHDSWGCPVSHALRMREIVRDSMVDLHSNYLFSDEEKAVGVAPLEIGDWDITEMAANMIGA